MNLFGTIFQIALIVGIAVSFILGNELACFACCLFFNLNIIYDEICSIQVNLQELKDINRGKDYEE